MSTSIEQILNILESRLQFVFFPTFIFCSPTCSNNCAGLRIYQILINKFRDQQIELSPCGRPILLITRMITDRTGLHLVLLPLLE